MQVFREIKALQAYLEIKKCEGATIGLVPTMGALHDGHLSLVKKSIQDNHITVTSIFVNPVQFNNPDDLIRYPGTLEEDLTLLGEVGDHVVFYPEQQEMYADKPVVSMDFGELERRMEGEFRPGHFNGVGIVVAKLLGIAKPHKAYFGQKDLQQFAVIQQLVKDLSYDVELKCMPIIREPDGLALSSRNRRLSPAERKKAPIFYEALKMAEKLYLQGNSIDFIGTEVRNLFDSGEVILEYFEIVDACSLEKIEDTTKKNVAMCIAGYVGEIRLIDNVIIGNEY